jgi:excisionase family DNA binding protein
MNDDRIALSVEEAAKLVGVGRATMYQACRERVIPSTRIGRRLVIGRNALLKLLDRAVESKRDL